MHEADQTPGVKKKIEGRWRRKNATFKNYILLLNKELNKNLHLTFFTTLLPGWKNYTSIIVEIWN